MTFAHFKQLLDKRYRDGTLYDTHGHVASDIIEEYIKNEKNLKDEFFEGIESDLSQDNVKNLSYYLGLLAVNPFNEEDNERFQRLTTRSIEILLKTNPSADISEHANLVWVLLDHMLHNRTMNDEVLMKNKLREFKVGLKKFEISHRHDVDLLYQKLGHFGIE